MSIQRESGRKVVLEKFYDLGDEICYFYECRDSYIKVLLPSSRQQANVHRTFAINGSNLVPQKRKIQNSKGVPEFGGRVSRFDKLRSCCRPAGSKRMSTGHSHLIVRISPQTEKTGNYVSSFPFFGPSVEIRTRGLLNPIQARYQTSPHPDASVDCQNILAQCFGKSKYFFDILKKYDRRGKSGYF